MKTAMLFYDDKPYADILDLAEFDTPAQVGPGDVEKVLKIANDRGRKAEFIVWMLDHRLRFGVRKIFQIAQLES